MSDFVSREPALAVGFLVFLASATVLVATGVGATEALLTALSISGLQAVLTRSKVSPAE